MAKLTAVEIRDMLQSGALTVADLEYNDVVSAADTFRQQQDGQSLGLIYRGMVSEVTRLTAPQSDKDRALALPAEQRVFNDSQLNQMPDMISYLEGFAVQGQRPDFSSEKTALETRVKQRLQDIKDGKETEISPLSVDDLRAMAARAGIDISAELEAALSKYAQDQGIDNVSKEQLEANHTVLADMASHLDFANDATLAVTKNIANGLNVEKNKEEPNAKAETDRELFREAAVNSAVAHLLTSEDFSSKVEVYNQETNDARKATLKAELENTFKAEINAQAATTAYAILLQNTIIAAEKKKGNVLTQEETNKLSEGVNKNLEKLSRGKQVSVRFDSFMGILAEKSAAWDERVAYLSKKYSKSLIPNNLQVRFSSWNQKMEQNHPKSWQFFKMAAVGLKKASPALALGGAALLSAGTIMAIPAAAAYGAYRISRGLKPLLKKFREDRKENPQAGFIETLKKNKIMTGRAVLSMVGGTLGLAMSTGSVALEVASATRIALATGGATLSTASAIDAWTDKKASKTRKWTETAMAAVSGAFAALGISKAVSADDVEVPVASAESNDTSAQEAVAATEVNGAEAASSQEVVATENNNEANNQEAQDSGEFVEADEVLNKLKAYNSANGMNNSAKYSWWSTRTPNDLAQQYDNLDDEVMRSYFPGMSREEVLMKYNRLDSWTARVKVLPNGDIVPLPNATRYHANEELAILKKIIECGEHPKVEDAQAAVDYMKAHITSNGDTDLPGIRTGNRIDTIKNPGCDEENQSFGTGKPAPKPEPEPKKEVVEETEPRRPIVTPSKIPVNLATPSLELEPVEVAPLQAVDNVIIHQGDYGNSFHYAGQVNEVEPQFDAQGRITNVKDVFNTEGADSQTMWLVKNEVTGKMDAYMLQDGKTPSVAYSDDPRYFGKVAGVEYKKDLFHRDHQAVWVDENGGMHRTGVNSKADAFKDIFQDLNDKGLVGNKGSTPLVERNSMFLRMATQRNNGKD